MAAKKKYTKLKIDNRPRGKDFAVLWDYMYGVDKHEIMEKYGIERNRYYRLIRKHHDWLVRTSELVDAEMAKQMAVRMVVGHAEYVKLMGDVDETLEEESELGPDPAFIQRKK